MSRPHAQDLHANDPQDAIDAYLHKYDIDNSPNGNVDPGTTFGDGTDMSWGHNSPGGDHGDDRAQDVHANNPQEAIEAYLHKYDIDNSLNGNVDLGATFGEGTDMYWGHGGNSPSGYHVSNNETLGIELALKEHVRGTGPDLVHTAGREGVANVTAPAGTDAAGTHALFNFDYVVDTGLNGSTKTLSDFHFKLQITEKATNGATNTEVFDLNPSTHVWTNEANPASHFGGDDFAHAATPQVQSQIAENSENLAFLGGVFGSLASATAAGTTYDVQLEAFHGAHLVGLVHDHILLA